jgi:hypothetical protein
MELERNKIPTKSDKGTYINDLSCPWAEYFGILGKHVTNKQRKNENACVWSSPLTYVRLDEGAYRYSSAGRAIPNL